MFNWSPLLILVIVFVAYRSSFARFRRIVIRKIITFFFLELGKNLQQGKTCEIKWEQSFTLFISKQSYANYLFLIGSDIVPESKAKNTFFQSLNRSLQGFDDYIFLMNYLNNCILKQYLLREDFSLWRNLLIDFDRYQKKEFSFKLGEWNVIFIKLIEDDSVCVSFLNDNPYNLKSFEVSFRGSNIEVVNEPKLLAFLHENLNDSFLYQDNILEHLFSLVSLINKGREQRIEKYDFPRNIKELISEARFS